MFINCNPAGKLFGFSYRNMNIISVIYARIVWGVDSPCDT